MSDQNSKLKFQKNENIGSSLKYFIVIRVYVAKSLEFTEDYKSMIKLFQFLALKKSYNKKSKYLNLVKMSLSFHFSLQQQVLCQTTTVKKRYKIVT